jgi:hypothetical protein
MQLKPIESVAKNLLIILIVGPALGVANAFFEGEIHAWADFGKALNHGGILAVAMAFAWIGMKSPWSGAFRTLVGSFLTVTAAGETQEAKVEASVPVDSNATMTVDATKQEVTVKQPEGNAPR